MARPLTFAKPSSEPSLAVDQVEGEQHRFDAPAFARARNRVVLQVWKRFEPSFHRFAFCSIFHGETLVLLR